MLPLALLPILGIDQESLLPTLAKVIANNRSGQVVPTSSLNVTMTNWTEAFDTLNAFDPVTGLFVAPADGYYQVEASLVATSGSASFGIALLVNDVARLQPSVVASGVATIGGLIHLAQNDVLRLGMTNFSGVSVTLFNNAGAPGENYLTIAQQL